MQFYNEPCLIFSFYLFVVHDLSESFDLRLMTIMTDTSRSGGNVVYTEGSIYVLCMINEGEVTRCKLGHTRQKMLAVVLVEDNHIKQPAWNASILLEVVILASVLFHSSGGFTCASSFTFVATNTVSLSLVVALSTSVRVPGVGHVISLKSSRLLPCHSHSCALLSGS